MDESQFDRLARSVGVATSRRIAVRGVAVGLLGAIGLVPPLSEARRRRHGGRKNCGEQYDGCNDGSDCCDGLICKRLENPSQEADFIGTCAYKRGCGKKNDYCQTNHDCCRDFRCRGHDCKRR
jgi:hypothetical protein